MPQLRTSKFRTETLLYARSKNLIRPRLYAKLAFASRLRRAGFTLMELILVLGVLVVLTAITLPGILRWQRALPMEQAVSMLQLQLQETRAAAIRSGEAWCLILPHASEPGRRQPLASSQVRNHVHSFRIPAGTSCDIIDAVGSQNQRPEATKQIVVQPDGTVRACRIRITTDTGIVTTLQIHRLTGTATVVQILVREQAAEIVASAARVETSQTPHFCPGKNLFICDSGAI